jgi:hypothetical protein
MKWSTTAVLVIFAAFGFFLEDRDLGFFLFFPEIMSKEERRAERQQGQQEFEEAFHRNLPFINSIDMTEKVKPCLHFRPGADMMKMRGRRPARRGERPCPKASPPRPF